MCLACKRLRQLCLAPELLRSIQLAAWGPDALPRAQSLQRFLERHARHVRHLTLHLQLQDPQEELPFAIGPEPLGELDAAVACCLVACAAASSSGAGLEELVLAHATDMSLTDAEQWLPRLTRLQVLWMGRETEALALPAHLSRLTALRELGLRAMAFPSYDEVRLPTSLTRLQVTGEGGTALIEHKVSVGQAQPCLQPCLAAVSAGCAKWGVSGNGGCCLAAVLGR